MNRKFAEQKWIKRSSDKGLKKANHRLLDIRPLLSYESDSQKPEKKRQWLAPFLFLVGRGGKLPITKGNPLEAFERLFALCTAVITGASEFLEHALIKALQILSLIHAIWEIVHHYWRL